MYKLVSEEGFFVFAKLIKKCFNIQHQGKK